MKSGVSASINNAKWNLHLGFQVKPTQCDQLKRLRAALWDCTTRFHHIRRG